MYSQGGASSCALLEANPSLYQSCATSIPFSNQTTNDSESIDPSCFNEPIKAPTWFFMKINVSGDIELQISQANNAGVGIDVDFTLWGPFSNLANICNQLNTTTEVDCSWLPDAVEIATIPNAIVGEFYILMVDNYTQQAGEISITQTAGTGSSDCSFLSSVSIKDESNNEITEFTYCKPTTKVLKAIVDITDFSFDPTNLRFNYRWSKDGIVISTLNNSLQSTNSITATQTGVYKIEIAAYDVSDPTIDITNIPFLPDQVDEINLEFIDPPILNSIPVLLEQCDFLSPNNDGLAVFDLTQAYNNITNSTSGITLQYFLDTGLNQEITNPTSFSNTIAFSQNIYVVGNIAGANIVCNSQTTIINLQVNPSSIANYPNPTPVCPEVGLTYGLFNLDGHKALIKNTFFPFSTVEISFYLTPNDASLEINEILNTNQFQIGTTTIYVRVESNNNCVGIGIFSAEVISPPAATTITPLNACLSDEIFLTQKDAEILLGQNPEVQTSYFFTNNDALNNTNTINKNIALAIPSTGTITLFVKLLNTNTQCFIIIPFNINVYQNPIYFVLNPSDILTFNETNSVTAIASPFSTDYVYNLNGGVWQESPIFNDLLIGENSIKVRNKNGCNEQEAFITVVDFPKFFTPNDDGINDEWLFTDKGVQFEATIYIFDRYGKLLKQVDKNIGWDGKINNFLLPSDDYWFRIFYTKNGIKKEFSSHFTLKR